MSVLDLPGALLVTVEGVPGALLVTLPWVPGAVLVTVKPVSVFPWRVDGKDWSTVDLSVLLWPVAVAVVGGALEDTVIKLTELHP